MDKPRSRAPLLVALLLLLPMMYVGSYLALVTPNDGFWKGAGTEQFDMSQGKRNWIVIGRWRNYRASEAICRVVFWPIEQIDRKVRPGRWEQEALFTQPEQ